MIDSKKIMKASKQTICFLCGITILWIILIIIINPTGNFPISDDFAYGKQVKILLETGKMTITDWSSMTLVAHIFIGALVCSIFGFSYTVLRITTLFFGLLGVISTYFLFREFSIKEKYSALVALIIAFHPYLYYHNYTFMTDTSFYSLSIIMIILYVKYIKYNHLRHFIFAIIFNITALLIRDIAIIFPISFAISYIYKNGFKFKNTLKIFLPAILIIITYLSWKYWTIYLIGNPKNLNYSQKLFLNVWLSGNIFNLLLTYLRNFVTTFIYMGLYIFPIILMILFSNYKKYTKKSIITFAIISILVFVTYLILLPRIQHNYLILFHFISGHIIVHNYFFPNVHMPNLDFYRFFSKNANTVISFIGIICGILLCFVSYHKIKLYLKKHNNKLISKREGVNEFIALNMFFYLFLIYSQGVMSRYLFLPIALFMLLLLINVEINYKKTFAKVSIIILFMAYYTYSSITAAHDLIEFNRQRFNALHYLDTDLKIDRKLIDGHFEYNAYYFYDYNYKDTKRKNMWWVYDDKYLVLWEKVQNYHVIKDYTWNRWFFPCNTEHAYILERNE